MGHEEQLGSDRINMDQHLVCRVFVGKTRLYVTDHSARHIQTTELVFDGKIVQGHKGDVAPGRVKV